MNTIGGPICSTLITSLEWKSRYYYAVNVVIRGHTTAHCEVYAADRVSACEKFQSIHRIFSTDERVFA